MRPNGVTVVLLLQANNRAAATAHNTNNISDVIGYNSDVIGVSQQL